MSYDYDISKEFESNYLYAHDYWSPYVSDALRYTKAAAGHTWTDIELKELRKEGREPIEFNITRRPIEFFSGYLRDNLNSIAVAPVEGSDQKTSTQFTKLSYDVWDKGRGYNTFLDSCDEMFKSGMSLCGIMMDYSKDFLNGDIRFFKRTFNSFYLDPSFENIDLSDCGFLITRDLVSRSYVPQLVPSISMKDVDELPTNFRDNKFISYRPSLNNISSNKKIISYDQYYRRTSRRRKFLIDERNDFFRDISDMSKEDLDQLKFGLHKIQSLNDEAQLFNLDRNDIPQLRISNVERPYVELNVMLNGISVYKGDDNTGITETFPMVPLLCFFESSLLESSKRVQGIGASEYSNQRQFNKRHMKIQDMFDSVISTGYKYLIGSVPDVTDLQQSGQNKLIGIDPEQAPEGLNSVQELVGGNVPPALIEYQKILDELSLTLANVNQSVLGIDEGGNTQVSGRLAQVRIAQGLRSNRKIMDNIELSQQVLGGLVVKCLQAKYPPGKIECILGEPPTQQFYDKEFEQYDAIIKESIRSKSQKDAYYYELLTLKRDGIVNVPENAIVDALQMSGIDELKDAIEQQAQQAQQQQQKVSEQEVLTMELMNAEKEEKIALAQERRARVVSDLSLAQERASEAEENRADAALTRAKTISELDGIDLDKILKILQFVNMMERQEVEDRENIKEDIYNKADNLNVDTEGSAEQKQVSNFILNNEQQNASLDTEQQNSSLDTENNLV